MTSNFPNFNLSLYTVPAVWALALAPRIYSIGLYNKSTSNPSDQISPSPRGFKDIIANDHTIPPSTRARLIRAEGASLNGMENLGLYAAAVVIGNAAGLDRTLLNRLSLGYLTARLAYTLVYINNETAALSNVRTGVYFLGNIIASSFFVLSGLKLNRN